MGPAIENLVLSVFDSLFSIARMSLRRWMREQMLGADVEGNDVPPTGSLVNSALRRDAEEPGSLGEYDSGSFPLDLAEVLRTRADVLRELMGLDVTDRKGRVAAIPQLKELLRRYPHPLVYEALINAYVDEGRYDEARGAAFAARERRHECESSPHPEIRAETDGLREWKPQEVDRIREEIEKGQS